MKTLIAFVNSFTEKKLFKCIKVVNAVIFVASTIVSIALIFYLIPLFEYIIAFAIETPNLNIGSFFEPGVINFTLSLFIGVLFFLSIPVVAVFSFILAFTEEKKFKNKLIFVNLIILSFVFIPLYYYSILASDFHEFHLLSLTHSLIPLMCSIASASYFIYLFCIEYEKKDRTLTTIKKKGKIIFVLCFFVLSLPYLGFDLFIGHNLFQLSNIYQTELFALYFSPATYAFLFGGLYATLFILFNKRLKISTILSNIISFLILTILIVSEFLIYHFAEIYNLTYLIYVTQICLAILYVFSIVFSFKLIEIINLILVSDIDKHPNFYETKKSLIAEK